MSMWTLDDGLAVVRSLQPLTRQFNYHLALGGGVLNNGSSDKDLDLYFLPLGYTKEEDNEKRLAKIQENADNLLKFLESMWGKSEPIGNGGGVGPRNRSELRPVRNIDGSRILSWVNVNSGLEIPADIYGDDHDKVIHRVKFIRPDDRIDVFIF